MTGKNRHNSYLNHAVRLVVWFLLCSLTCVGQSQPQTQAAADTANSATALQELQSQVRELKQLVLQLQSETVDSHAEITRLRQEIETQRGNATAAESTGLDEQSPGYAGSTATLEQRLEHVEEDQQLLSGKIDDQYQTKLESASKYRIRFSGIVLFNLFGNSGSVDNLDVPTWAAKGMPGNSSGAVGATMRQSILGFEALEIEEIQTDSETLPQDPVDRIEPKSLTQKPMRGQGA